MAAPIPLPIPPTSKANHPSSTPDSAYKTYPQARGLVGIRPPASHVRFVPKTDSCGAAKAAPSITSSATASSVGEISSAPRRGGGPRGHHICPCFLPLLRDLHVKLEAVQCCHLRVARVGPTADRPEVGQGC